MKRLFSLLATTALLGFIAAPADATLIDRGAGLIYDTDLNITWMRDANYAKTSGYDADGLMSWNAAITWADNLVYGGFSDWRLPSTVPQNYALGFDGTTGIGFNITKGSELGHLFYSELNNKGYYSTNGICPQPGWGLLRIDWFQSTLRPFYYWSSTE